MKTVMVVDDNPLIGTEFKLFLIRFGYQPVVIEKSKEAISGIKEYAPNLIITDYEMKAWPDGMALARFVKRECKIPIIMISLDKKAEKLANEDDIPFLIKPFDCNELEKLIKELLKRR